MNSARVLTILTTLIVAAPAAYSLGFRVPEQDARATGRANAFVATADNPSAIYYNPAGLAMLNHGIQIEQPPVSLMPSGKGYVPAEQAASTDGGLLSRMNFYGITLESEFSPVGGGAGFDLKRDYALIPTSFLSWHPAGSRFTFGFGSYAPYGLGLEWPENQVFRREAISGRLMYLTFNPVVAYRVSETLSIAGGATINYGRAQLKRGVFKAHDMFEFDGEGWGFGFNAGLMWRPSEKHSFGVNYRSQTDIAFEGDTHLAFNSFRAGPGGVVRVPGVDKTESAEVGIKFPQNVAVGYSYRPTPKWNIEVNADWTDWDNLNTLHLYQQNSGRIDLPFNWQSSWIYSIGASHTFDNGLTASLGYAFLEESVPDESYNPSIPDNDRHLISAGVGGKYRGFDWDLAYIWAYGPSRDVDRGTPVDGEYQYSAHGLQLGIGSRF